MHIGCPSVATVGGAAGSAETYGRLYNLAGEQRWRPAQRFWRASTTPGREGAQGAGWVTARGPDIWALPGGRPSAGAGCYQGIIVLT